MKKIIVFLFCINLFALNISFKVTLPGDLQTSFVNYWSYRANKNFEKTYKMELPYQRYLHTLDEYEDFFALAPRLKSIKVLKITKLNPYKYAIFMMFKTKQNASSTKEDIWVNVNKKWYHKYNEKVLPF